MPGTRTEPVCRHVVAFASVWLWCGVTIGAETLNRIEISAGGRSPYAIVVPDHADQERTTRAARLLQATLQEASMARLPIVNESGLTPGTPAFSFSHR